MRIALIAALSRKGVIGNENTLPWHIPEELHYFKKTTLGKPIIMGRKTFESIGSKPLPKRLNIVLTQQKGYSAPGCEVVSSVENALVAAGQVEEVMVIGGAEIFKSFLPLAHRLYLSFIETDVRGDTYFPEISWDEWERVFEDKNAQFTATIFDKRAK